MQRGIRWVFEIVTDSEVTSHGIFFESGTEPSVCPDMDRVLKTRSRMVLFSCVHSQNNIICVLNHPDL